MKDDPTEAEITLAEALRNAVYRRVAPHYEGVRVFDVKVAVVADVCAVSAQLPDALYLGTQKFSDLERIAERDGVPAAVEAGVDEFFRYRKVFASGTG